jgi:hypothetical protein
MHCLIENRVDALIPWIERRLNRAVTRSDEAGAFRAIRLMERITALQDHPAYSRELAIERNKRLLQSN